MNSLFQADCDALLNALPADLQRRELFRVCVEADGEFPIAFPFERITEDVTARIPLLRAAAILERGEAEGVGIDLQRNDGLFLIRLRCFDPISRSLLPPDAQRVVDQARTYTEFSYDPHTLTILCHGFMPAAFRNFGWLNDGTKIEMYDENYFVSLRGVSFGTNNDVALRQNEINEICEKYLDRKCPIVGTDGALAGIMAAVLQYSDMREAFDKYWKKRLAVRRKELRENESPLPPEFAAALDAMQHLFVCGREHDAK